VLKQNRTLTKILWSKLKTFKFKMADGRHMQNVVFGYNTTTNCPIFAKLCMMTQNPRQYSQSNVANLWEFKMADDRHLEDRHVAIFLWKWNIIRYWWNCVCCTRLRLKRNYFHQKHKSARVWSPTWRTDAIFKKHFSYNCTTVCPIRAMRRRVIRQQWRLNVFLKIQDGFAPKHYGRRCYNL